MSSFSKEELIRYNRQMMLPEIGLKGQETLKQAKILVVGAGGLGCPVLQYLSACGVGTIGIVDFDKVERHNLHRQILYTSEDIGKSKSETAAKKLRQQNEHIQFIVFDEMLSETNASDIICQFDTVVDGSDNFLTRYLVNDTCVQLNKSLVYGSILKFEAQLAVFNYKGSKNLRDLYPEPPNPEEVPNCDENGVLGVIPGILGLYMALKTIYVVLGKIENPNQLQLFNFMTDSHLTLTF
jgi:molybdopterin/thiamine biosynthesis adenylyltransferase